MVDVSPVRIYREGWFLTEWDITCQKKILAIELKFDDFLTLGKPERAVL